MKLLIILLAVLFAVGCVGNQEVGQATSAKEIISPKPIISSPVETPPVSEVPVPETTTTVPAVECRPQARIVYFLLNGETKIYVKVGTIVTLSWKFLNVDDRRTLWDLGRLPSEGTMELTITQSIAYRVRVCNDWSSAVATCAADVI